MKAFDQDFYLQMTNHLNSLEESDYDEDDSGLVIGETNQLTEISEENKAKLFTTPEFKNFLQSYLKKKYNKEKQKITNKYSERIYRNMYAKNVLTNRDINLFTKVMYHPDVTKTDYEYIREKLAGFPKVIFYNEAALFLVMGYCYFKTSFGGFVRKNPIAGAAILGLSPMTVLLGTQKLNAYLLNYKLRSMGLLEKYNLKY
jgi:hypothetical protein